MACIHYLADTRLFPFRLPTGEAGNVASVNLHYGWEHDREKNPRGETERLRK